MYRRNLLFMSKMSISLDLLLGCSLQLYSAVLLGCSLPLCYGAELSAAAPSASPFVKLKPATSVNESAGNPRIHVPWFVDFAHSILDNITIDETEHEFYERLAGHEVFEEFGYGLKMAFCRPATSTSLFSLFNTHNATLRKMADFFVDEHLMRLDRMVEAEQILHRAIHNTIDNMAYKKWFRNNATGDERSKGFWQEVFDPLGAYLRSYPRFEQEFAKFQTYYDEKHLQTVQKFKNRYVNTTAIGDTSARKMVVHNDGSSEFSDGFPLFMSLFEAEENRMAKLGLRYTYLKSILPTYQELRSKENYELERVIIAEAIQLLGEWGAETREMAQKLFDEVIREMLQEYVQQKIPRKKMTNEILLEKLQNKFESAPELTDKFLQAKKDVKNQILVMHNTVADSAAREWPL